MKICSTCLLPQDLGQFHRDKTKADGHNAMCKACRKAKLPEYTQNRERSICCLGCHKTATLYAQKRCRPCYDKNHRRANPAYANRQKENRKSWGQRFPEKVKAANRRKWEKIKSDPERLRKDYNKNNARQYGLTVDEYLTLISRPCDLCETTTYERYVDHCHTTENVRGALCHGCNLGVGFIDKRGIGWLRKTLTYLGG